MIVKLRVNPEDKANVETIIQSSQVEIQDLRHKLKIPASEHMQSRELAQGEGEKEILAKDLIDKNNEVVALKQ